MNYIKKLIFFFSICTLYSIVAKSQVKLPELSLGKAQNVVLYIGKYYKPKSGFIDTSCINSMVFIKFKVSDKGSIDSLDISKNGPSALKEALKIAILNTNGLWKSTTNEKRLYKNKTFLLPVIFHYQSGCQINKKDLVNVDKNGNLTIMYGHPYGKIDSSLNNFLDFENCRLITLDCILLTPITFSAED